MERLGEFKRSEEGRQVTLRHWKVVLPAEATPL
jgi:hypothetical protein